MKRQSETNIELLLHVARHLGSLADDMVFTGGCIVSLLITDDAAPDVRPTGLKSGSGLVTCHFHEMVVLWMFTLIAQAFFL